MDPLADAARLRQLESQVEGRALLEWFLYGIWRLSHFILAVWVLCNVFDIARSIVAAHG